MTDEYLKSVDTIHAAIPPGTTEEFFRSKISPILEVRAKAAGYAAMVGEVMTAAITASLFIEKGRRAAVQLKTKLDSFVESRLQDDDVRAITDMFRDVPSAHSAEPSIVIDSDTKVVIPYEEDRGYRPTAADDIQDNVKKRYKNLGKGLGTIIHGGSALTGIAAGAAVIERGPVHAVAKLSAKVEGAAGAAVVKIVDRIMKGW